MIVYWIVHFGISWHGLFCILLITCIFCVFPLSQSICLRGMGVNLNDCVLDSSFWDIVAWFILYFTNIMYILCIPFEPIYIICDWPPSRIQQGRQSVWNELRQGERNHRQTVVVFYHRLLTPYVPQLIIVKNWTSMLLSVFFPLKFQMQPYMTFNKNIARMLFAV